MSRCADCQYQPAQGARFCPLCGKPLPLEIAQASWERVVGPVGTLTVSVSIGCAHCSTPMPVNGPTASVHCGHCRAPTMLDDLGAAIRRVAAGEPSAGACTIVAHPGQAGPSCPGCALEVPLGDSIHFFGVVSTLACARCGAAVTTFPAPAWLTEAFPEALQVFGADAEVAARETGHALGLGGGAIRPDWIACPTCGGASVVTAITGPTLACSRCGGAVPIPERVWSRLHPVATMRRWTVTYRAAAPDERAVPWVGAETPSDLLFRVLRNGVVVEETVVCGTTDVKMGRSPSCEIRIDDVTVGRIHAVVEIACNGDLALVDLGTPTGTRLNGEAVHSSTPLRIGDRIDLGDTTIEIVHP